MRDLKAMLERLTLLNRQAELLHADANRSLALSDQARGAAELHQAAARNSISQSRELLDESRELQAELDELLRCGVKHA